jgi:hypothetical protein
MLACASCEKPFLQHESRKYKRRAKSKHKNIRVQKYKSKSGAAGVSAATV